MYVEVVWEVKCLRERDGRGNNAATAAANE